MEEWGLNHWPTREVPMIIFKKVKSTKSDRGEILYGSPYMWNLKRNYTDEFIYETERDSQTLENKLMVAGGGSNVGKR